MIRRFSEVAVRILQNMLTRRILYCLCLCATLPVAGWSQSVNDAFFDDANRFFGKYVHANHVDYAAVSADDDVAVRMHDRIAAFDLHDAGRRMRRAFYLNAYNLLVILAVAERQPAASPDSIAGFFTEERHAVAGDSLTLDGIAHILDQDLGADIRYRFWLWAGTAGSPPPEDEAAMPFRLDRQFDDRLKRLASDDRYVRVDHEFREVQLPVEFYAVTGTAESDAAISALNRYRRHKVPAGYSVGYYIAGQLFATREVPRQDARTTTDPDAVPADSTVGQEHDIRDPIPPEFLEDHIVSEATNMLSGPFQARASCVLLTHHASYNADWDRINYDYRYTTFNMTFQFWSRVSPRVNIGVQFLTRTLQLNGFDASPYEAITFSNDSNTAFFLRHVMNSVKYLVVDRKFRVVAQSSFLVPVSRKVQVRFENNKQGDVAIAQWINQLMAVRHFSRYFTLCSELNAVVRLGSKDADKVLNIRGSLLPEFNFWFSRTFRFYAFLDLNPQLNHGPFSNCYLREGTGLTLRGGKGFQLDLQYSYDAVGKKSGAVNAFTLAGRFNL